MLIGKIIFSLISFSFFFFPCKDIPLIAWYDWYGHGFKENQTAGLFCKGGAVTAVLEMNLFKKTPKTTKNGRNQQARYTEKG